MKRIKIALNGLLFFLVLNIPCFAQRTTSTQSFNQLRVNNVTISINNMSLTDAVGTNGQVFHTASFDIILNDHEATKTVLLALQSAQASKALVRGKESGASGPAIYFITVNSNFAVTEEKTYTGITLEEMRLPDMNAAEQSGIKVSVKLNAANVMVTAGGGKAAMNTTVRTANIAASFFRVTMGSLPCSRILKVGATAVKPMADQYQNFSIEMMGLDGAAWNQWFLSGAAGAKKEQGTIELLGRDMKSVLYTIQLTDVEIISYTVTNNGSIARATAGLRLKQVTLK